MATTDLHPAASDERRQFLLWTVLLSAVYFAITPLLAQEKLMWTDELFSFYLSSLPDLQQWWAAMSTGADQHPPTFYLITRLSMAAFGENELALRMPQVIAVWVMCCCLGVFIARRTSAIYGILAMTIPLVTNTYYYAYEGRGYGLVLGFAGMTVLAWQLSEEQHFRWFALPLLALGVMGAIGSHYYAILILAPLGMAECVRTWTRRRLDLSFWLTLTAAAALPVLVFFPHIQASRGFSKTFWAIPYWSDMLHYTNFLFGGRTMTPLFLILVVAGVVLLRRSPRDEAATQRTVGIPTADLTMLCGLIAVPAIAFFLAKTVTNGYHARYGIVAAIGMCGLAALLYHRLFAGRPKAAALSIAFLLVWFISGNLIAFLQLGHFRRYALAELAWVDEHREDHSVPLVFARNEDWYKYCYYAPGREQEFLYLTDTQEAQKRLGHDTVDRCALALEPWFRMPMEDYRDFIEQRRKFYVLTDLNPAWTWLTSALEEDGLKMEIVAIRSRTLLLEVAPKEVQSELPLAMELEVSEEFDDWSVLTRDR